MITRSLAQYKDKQTGERRLLFKSTKGNNPKPITVPESLVPILEKHRQQQNQLKQQLGAAYQDNDLIFCQENGAPLWPNSVSLGQRVIPVPASRPRGSPKTDHRGSLQNRPIQRHRSGR